MTSKEFKEFGETKDAFPAGECLPELLREQLDKNPDDTAVVHGNETVTYRELVRTSSDLAAYLHHLGVVRDDCVGVFAEPSIDLLIGAWGILFAGSAYLPLSPDYPEERLRYMLADSGTKVVLAQEKLRSRLAELAPEGTLVATLEDAAAFARSDRTAAAVRSETGSGPGPRSLAYVIYTSGSTGQPKGVMIEHRSIVNQMRWLRDTHNVGPGKTVLQKTPMSFDAAQWEILAVGCGSKVVMGSAGIHRDPERLIEAVVRHRVTTLQCVPTLLQALVDTDELRDCTSLTQIFSGGEALSGTLAAECLAALPGCELVNLYGPTECTINSSAYTVDKAVAVAGDGSHSVPIGTPVAGTRYHILDDSRVPVAPGETGELYVSGIQLARGYLHRPELTAARFTVNPFSSDAGHDRLYRTGDLARWNADGNAEYVGRVDTQVKLRGFRIELDEIRLRIETHDWVKNAAVIVKKDLRTGFQNLVSFVELNPKEAALMDQGNHGAHHQSKASRLQVKAQLSNRGCRDAEELDGKTVVDLPGREPTPEQRRLAFSRKTYRFFEGGSVDKADILRLLGRRVRGTDSRGPEDLSRFEMGRILRYFGQYLSEERLLPKYGYASPGSLYATQMYFELDGLAGLEPGFYYYHPVHHRLVLISEKAAADHPRIKIHFMGKKRAVEPVYRNNIQEVLEIETGHMVGLFEEILPGHGLSIIPLDHIPAARDHLECAAEDYYLGTFEIVRYAPPVPDDSLEIYVQPHPGKVDGLPAGQYLYRDGDLEPISDELVLKKHVIAINQQVYERSSLGITVISKSDRGWLRYVELGRKLQHLQMNDLNIGFMSSGYSSKTGNDLPSAKRMQHILEAGGRDGGPSYFFVGGRVSDDQVRGEDMKEDVVHMKGPAELIKDDLAAFLPDYMVPNRVTVLDRLPLTANGKIDSRALEALEAPDSGTARPADRPYTAPRTETERRVGEIWKTLMKREDVSVLDDFFESGGNSLIAVGIINRINREFRSSLPLQVLFDSPTVEKLALSVDDETAEPPSRLVLLRAGGEASPAFCWPGLGGYTMNLKPLAEAVGGGQPFYGVQAHGINEGETPYPTIKEMAAADIKAMKRLHPEGPYTLWGYSFGARVAFETAYQLEQAGDRVTGLFLIAPGSPALRSPAGTDAHDPDAAYRDKAYLTILFSVFAGTITGPALEECLGVVRDEDTFASFIADRYRHLDRDLVKRVMRIVQLTYRFKYTFDELLERRISAPVTIFKAQGDDYSFIESSNGYSAHSPTVFEIEADHYSILKPPHVDGLVDRIRLLPIH
ncbi:MAG: hypothetical protein QOF44_977 [Streptomyces sp.]|nr:hypothetical protein [Streptomyces sp.]